MEYLDLSEALVLSEQAVSNNQSAGVAMIDCMRLIIGEVSTRKRERERERD